MKKIFTLMAFSSLTLFSTQAGLAQDQSETKPSASPTITTQKIGDWTIRCIYPNQSITGQEKIKKECAAQQTLTVVDKKTNKTVPVASIILEQGAKIDKKAPQTKLSLVVPTGFSLLKPAELNADQQKLSLPWTVCHGNQCIASSVLTDSFKTTLEKNENIGFVVHRVNNTTLTVNFKMNNLTQTLLKMNELINKLNP